MHANRTLKDERTEPPKAKVAAFVGAPIGESVSFPTEQRTRQKARKQAGHVAKRRPQIVEQHHDDCGEDFSPLGEDFLANIYYEDDALDGIYEERLVILTSWVLGYNGSTYLPNTVKELSETAAPMIFDDMDSFARWDVSSSTPRGVACDDVAQLCGGAGESGA